MREIMTLSELMNLLISITENGMRSSQWLEALNDGPITRSVEGQTLTVTKLGHQAFEVTFK